MANRDKGSRLEEIRQAEKTRWSYEIVDLNLIDIPAELGEDLDKDARHLLESIGLVDVLQAPGILRLGNGRFRVIYGRTRTRAMQLDGRESGWFMVTSQEPSGIMAAVTQEIENVARRDPWIQQVANYHHMIDMGWSKADVAKTLAHVTGKTRNSFYPLLDIAELPEPFYSAVIAGQIANGVARRLSKLAPTERQRLISVLDEHHTLTMQDIKKAKQVSIGKVIELFETDDEDDDAYEQTENHSRSLVRQHIEALRQKAFHLGKVKVMAMLSQIEQELEGVE